MTKMSNVKMIQHTVFLAWLGEPSALSLPEYPRCSRHEFTLHLDYLCRNSNGRVERDPIQPLCTQFIFLRTTYIYKIRYMYNVPSLGFSCLLESVT